MFFLTSGKTCLFFSRSCSSCTLFISLAAESTEEVEEHGTKEFSTRPSSLAFDFLNYSVISIFFSRSDPRVVSMLWNKLNKENKTPSGRTELCNAVVSWLFLNIRIREKIECFLSETSFLDLLSKLIQSIFVISDDGEHVRIKLQNIWILKMKKIRIWCV